VRCDLDELINAHRGQGIEIFWRENMICPTEEQYLEMVGNSMIRFRF
jgi:geranylgeranyl diphosphate synthase type 3